MRNITILLLLVSCLAFGAGCSSDTQTEPVSSLPPDADNTERNDQKTPDALASTDPLDQGETEEDLRITSEIRKSIVSDKSLSTNAHNIKIMTAAGKVTLRGPVKSAHEKSKIEGYAKIAGVGSVDNMLEVEKNP
jgi:osmotically-inducible protein OsmY